MKWAIVNGMPMTPHACAGCGNNPRDEDNEPVANAFAEGVDIDWGGSLYICRDCVRVLAELYGYIVPREAEELRARVEELEEVESAFEEYRNKVKVLINGNKAKKELKNSA